MEYDEEQPADIRKQPAEEQPATDRVKKRSEEWAEGKSLRSRQVEERTGGRKGPRHL